jgi:hypothetical protein
MWSSQQLGQAGASLASSIGGFIAQSIQAKSDAAWARYNNAMLLIQNGMNQNVITTNENIKREQMLQKRFAIEKSKYVTTSSAEVVAAATGTIGRSVNAVLFDVQRNATQAQQQNNREFEYVKVSDDQERVASTLHTNLSMDLSKMSSNETSKMLGL